MTGHSNKSLESDAIMACVQIGKKLASTVRHEQILEIIMYHFTNLIKAENWSLFLHDRESGELYFEIVVGIDKKDVAHIRIPPGKGIVGQTALSGQPLIIRDAQNDSRFNSEIDRKTGFSTKTIICLPLVAKESVLGVLEIINVADLDDFLTNYFAIARVFCDYAAIALENARLFEQIEKLTITDEYTGLYNARYMHEILGKLLTKAKKSSSNLAAVFMDIDNFKQIVDSYGHLAGSKVLREIGLVIQECLDPTDILIKYGGDEYVILLPDRSKNQVKRKMEKIRSKINQTFFLQEEGKNIRITASAGIAVYPQDAKSKKTLLLKADNLMYTIKKAHKNGIGSIG